MLRSLHISNLILIDQAVLELGSGFLVVTGETGAGKSALLSALSLLVGDRADSSVIRSGEEKATIEASFDLEKRSSVATLLEESGIDCDPNEPLVIKREIRPQGKGRVFINHQPAQLKLLKQCGDLLIRFAGQRASIELLDLNAHRHFLDRYAKSEKVLIEFQNTWKEVVHLEKEIRILHENESVRVRELTRLREETDRILNAKLKEGEEEELFSEYSRLTYAEELTQVAEESSAAIEETLIPRISEVRKSLEQAASKDDGFTPIHDSVKEALILLQESAYSLKQNQSKLEANPYRQKELDERLKLLDGLKKRFGSSLEEVIAYGEKAQKELDALEHSDERLEELEEMLRQTKKRCDETAKTLTEHRKKGAKKFAHEIEETLKELNMPSVRVKVNIEAAVRSVNGDEQIELFFSPNAGEKMISVKDSASGGELARVMLAIYLSLSGRDGIPTLIFDEIDANIGGKTAVSVGKKLQELGVGHQVLCVSHFPQVARQADAHFLVHKEEKKGRTATRIQKLEGLSRQEELARMVGEEKPVLTPV